MGSTQSKTNFKADFKKFLSVQEKQTFNKPNCEGKKPSQKGKNQSGNIIVGDLYFNTDLIESNSNDPNIHLNQNSFSAIKQQQQQGQHKLKNPNISAKQLQMINISQDNRKKADCNKYPYTCIGYIKSEFGNNNNRGTGFLVSPNCVLTCAHNLYNRKTKTMAKKVDFILGLKQNQGNDDSFIGLVVEASTWKVPEQYMDPQYNEATASLYDFALLKLNNYHDFQANYGFLGINSEWCTLLNKIKQTQLILSGYPQAIKGHNQCKNQMEAKGPWVNIELDEQAPQESLMFLSYKIFTSKGQSGSPIFYEHDKRYYVVGIHTLGNNQSDNKGVLLTTKVRTTINQWIMEMNKIFDISKRYIGNQGIANFLKPFQTISNSMTELRLRNNRIGPAGMAVLTSVTWNSLKVLNLQNNNIKVEGAMHLAKKEQGWQQLQYLNLNTTSIGDKGWSALLQDRDWLKLKKLLLDSCGLQLQSISEMSNKKWPALQVLHLANNKLTQQHLNIILSLREGEPERLGVLAHLNLSNNPLKSQGLQVIVQEKNTLKSLQICQIGINSQSMKIFASKIWINLANLSLSGNDISDQGISYLSPDILPKISYLNLDQTTLGSLGVQSLMRYQWPLLKTLSLNNDYLNDDGLIMLVYQPSLQVLRVGSNSISSAGIIHFSQGDGWVNLIKLNINLNNIKEKALQKLISKFVKLNQLDINNNGLTPHQKRNLKIFALNNNPNLAVKVEMEEQINRV